MTLDQHNPWHDHVASISDT